MDETVSVRELRNKVSEVLRRVESGERITVTVDRRPVAELRPLRKRGPVPVREALAIVSRWASDRQLLSDIEGAAPDTTDDI
ncbi:MAG: type II toxin-antitoxin system prevent-host-death family antitoxin [Actinomycetota bacterium]